MKKIIDLNNSIEKLCSEYPELIEIMSKLGFKNITNTITLKTIGKFMTIPKGAKVKDIPLKNIISELEQKGYEVIHIPNNL